MLAFPWQPRHFATGRMNSMPESSAMRLSRDVVPRGARSWL